jgi:hypothetical protein
LSASTPAARLGRAAALCWRNKELRTSSVGLGDDFLRSLATLPDIPRFRSALKEIPFSSEGNPMNSIVYIVGLVVIIGAILAFLGLR